jgi:hypothetical protein
MTPGHGLPYSNYWSETLSFILSNMVYTGIWLLIETMECFLSQTRRQIAVNRAAPPDTPQTTIATESTSRLATFSGIKTNLL